MLWFFLWRTTLTGLALGAILGGAYAAGMPWVGFVFGVLAGEAPTDGDGSILVGWFVFATPFGAVSGAITGLVLGAANGLLLCTISWILHPAPPSARAYREVAGLACAVTTAVALLIDWVLNDALAPHRIVEVIAGNATGDQIEPLDPGSVVFNYVIPQLFAVGAMWFSGRRVADRYAVVSRGL